MVDERRKMARKVAKERAQSAHAAYLEEDTIYWVCFTPKPGFPVPPNEGFYPWTHPMCVLLSHNPEGRPELIDGAIREFENKFQIDTWRAAAVGYSVQKKYNR